MLRCYTRQIVIICISIFKITLVLTAIEINVRLNMTHLGGFIKCDNKNCNKAYISKLSCIRGPVTINLMYGMHRRTVHNI